MYTRVYTDLAGICREIRPKRGAIREKKGDLVVLRVFGTPGRVLYCCGTFPQLGNDSGNIRDYAGTTV